MEAEKASATPYRPWLTDPTFRAARLRYRGPEPISDGCLGVFQRTFNTIVPHGKTMSGAFNLASATLGVAILSMPSSFMSCGVVLCCLGLIAVTVATVYSIFLLVRVGDKVNCFSFPDLSRRLMWPSFQFFTSMLMGCFCLSVCVAYVASTVDLIFPFLEGIQGFWGTKNGAKCITLIIWMCLMYPLSLPREINALRYVSTLGVSFVIYFTISVVVRAFQEDFRFFKQMALFRGGNGLVSGISLCLFAYVCQTNCFEIYIEMRDPTPRNMMRDSGISMSVVCFLYLVAGLCGYAAFGDNMQGSVLDYYKPLNYPATAVAYVGMMIKLTGGFAINLQPSRDAFYSLLHWDVYTVAAWKHRLFCSGLSITALLIGLLIPKLETYFSFLGGLCGGFIGFIFPALFTMYSGNFNIREMGYVHFICTYALLLAGATAVVFGTGSTIYDFITG